MLVAVFATCVQDRGTRARCARAHMNARIVCQMIGCDVIQANLFSEKDSSDYGQSRGLPRNTPLAAPYGWVLKPRARGLMTERMCRAHAEGCSGGGGWAKKTLIKSLAWKGCARSAVRRGQGDGL